MESSTGMQNEQQLSCQYSVQAQMQMFLEPGTQTHSVFEYEHVSDLTLKIRQVYLKKMLAA